MRPLPTVSAFLPQAAIYRRHRIRRYVPGSPTEARPHPHLPLISWWILFQADRKVERASRPARPLKLDQLASDAPPSYRQQRRQIQQWLSEP